MSKIYNFFIIFTFSVFQSVQIVAQDESINETLPIGSNVQDSLLLPERIISDVFVVGDSITRYPDKDVVRITKFMRRGSRDVAQMLGKVPGLFYGRLDKSISYYGSNKVIILIDSIEKDESYIKQLHHLRFDKVELIPNPKGKYSDYDVIINLHTKPLYEGYENNISAQTQFTPTDQNGKGKNFMDPEVSENFTYTRNKWNFVVGYSGNFNQTEHNSISTVSYLMNNYKEFVINNRDERNNYYGYGRNHNAMTSVDYQFNKKTSLSLSYHYTYGNGDEYTNVLSVKSDLIDSYHDTIHIKGVDANEERRHSFGVFFRSGIRSWNYNVRLNYVDRVWDADKYMRKSSGFMMDDDRHKTFRHSLSQLDVNRRFFDDKLNYGLIYTYFWRQYNQFSNVDNVLLSSNKLTYHSLWTGLTYSFTSDFSIGANGLIVKYDTDNSGTKDTYMTYSGALNSFWKINRNSWLRFDYSCGIANPQLEHITTYGVFTDSLQWCGGNPNVRASITHNATLRFHFLKYLTMSGGLTYSPRNFSSITSMREGYLPNGLWSSYAATTTQNGKNFGTWCSLNYSRNIKDFSFNGDVSYIYNQSDYEIFKNHAAGWNFNLQASYYWGQKNLYFALVYKTLNVFNGYAQSINTKKGDAFGIVVNKTLMKDKVELFASYTLPWTFTSCKDRTNMQTPIMAKTAETDIKAMFNNIFCVSLSYRISGGKSVRQYNRMMSEEK